MSPLFQLVLVVFLLISNNGGGAVYGYSAFMIRLKAQDQACFYENLNSNERTDLSFQVAEGGNLDIDFWVNKTNQNIREQSNEKTAMCRFLEKAKTMEGFEEEQQGEVVGSLAPPLPPHRNHPL